jgi:flavin reductase (DIM6/NTAB) family NADH-FMN oxidoreductase RutF
MAVVVGYVPTAEGRAALHRAALECRLLEVRSFGDRPRSGHVVLGEVLHLVVAAEFMADDGLPDPDRLDLAARADRSHWARTGTLVSIERPRWPHDAGSGPE